MDFYEKFFDYWSLFNVSRETFLQLEKFVFLLIEENKLHNLVRFSSLEELWKRHIIDSAQLSLYVSRETKKIIDVGSGNGCPGIVISLLLPTKEVYLVESKQKKAAFLKKCIKELSLNTKVIEDRIEKTVIPKTDCITARAVTDLSQLLEWIEPTTNKKTYCLFLKGRKWEEEINNSLKKWSFEYKAIESLTDKEGKILFISSGQKRKK